VTGSCLTSGPGRRNNPIGGKKDKDQERRGGIIPITKLVKKKKKERFKTKR